MSKTTTNEAKNIENTKNLLIIELSEFSIELLSQAVALRPLPNIAKILQFKKSSYKTNDRYNSGYLEPHSQWVSVHTGVPARTHSVKAPDAQVDPALKTCWQVLGENNITTGIWGILNTAEVRAEYNAFCIPPLSKPSTWSLLKMGFKLGCFSEILKALIRFKNPSKLEATYLSWLDTLNALFFSQLKQKHQPQCSILSLRSLAYCQYYHWEGDDKTLSGPILDNLQAIEKILGLLIWKFPNDSFIIHNALSQMKANYEAVEPISGKSIKRTGRLIPLGTIYSQDISFPNHIFNHEFNHYIYHYFTPEKYRLKSEYIEDEMAAAI